MRRLIVTAGAAWVIVAGYGALNTVADLNDDWGVPYAVYSLALLVGVLVVLAIVEHSTRNSPRPRLRMAGMVVTGLAGAASFVAAWAVPLWMTLLGLGLATLAGAGVPGERRALGMLAGGQVVGLLVLFGGLIAEVGRQDEYGDHPVPGGIAIIVAAALVIAGLVELRRGTPRRLAGDRP